MSQSSRLRTPSEEGESRGTEAECDQVPPVAKQRSRRRLRVDQFAVGGEHGRRTAEVGEQTARAIGQGEVAGGALGRNDQDRGGVVGKRQARAKTYQHTTQRRAETAQAFKPWRIPSRKRRDETRDLSRRGMLCLEMQHRSFARGGGFENCCARGIGPQNMLGVGAPKPDRRGAERMRRQPLITKICKLRVGFRHSGVAEFTANRVLIRPVTDGVHGTTRSPLSEPAISLMRITGAVSRSP